jgi:hypothetical protein
MGTSASFRSPPKDPLWRLVNRAYDAQLPLERIRAEIFNAGGAWAKAIAEPAMVHFPVAVVEAHDALANQLREARDPGHAIEQWAAAARERAVEDGAPTAAALGERALTSVLLRIASTGDNSVLDASGAAAAEAWLDARGSRRELPRHLLGAVLEQYAKHVVARDNGRLVAEGRSTREARELTRHIARLAATVAQNLPAREATTAESWARYVRDAFKVGRALPE